MIGFAYHSPTSLDETFALLTEHGDEARLLAGGTALLILMKQQLVRPAHVISLRKVPKLSEIAERNGEVSIGGLATHRDLETSALIARRFQVFTDTLRHVATVRIRNMGTIGGNLAHADPALDPPVTLIALDARVRLVSRGGVRTVRLDEFFTDYYETVLEPGEVLTEVLVPKPPPRSAANFTKFLPRTADDYATVSAATRVTLDPSSRTCQDARIALGAAGATTIRARQAEAVLRGQPITDAAVREAARVARTEVDPIADIRGSSEYKRDMAEVMVRRALTRTLAELGAA